MARVASLCAGGVMEGIWNGQSHPSLKPASQFRAVPFNMVPMHPGILEKFLNFILKVQGLEIYLNFVKNPGIFNKILEKLLSLEYGIIFVEFCVQIT